MATDACPVQCDLLYPPNTPDLREANDKCKTGCIMAASLRSNRLQVERVEPALSDVPAELGAQEPFSQNPDCGRDCVQQNFGPANAISQREEVEPEIEGGRGHFFRSMFNRDWSTFFKPQFWADVEIVAPPAAADVAEEPPMPPAALATQLANHRRMMDLVMNVFERFGLSPRVQESSDNLPPTDDMNDVVVETVDVPLPKDDKPDQPAFPKQEDVDDPVILFSSFKKNVVGPRYSLDSEEARANFGLMECFAQRARNLSMFTKLLLYSALILCSACLIWIGTLFLRSGFKRRSIKKEPEKNEVIYCVPSPYYFEKCSAEKLEPPTAGGPPGYSADRSSEKAITV
ncbi:unnamed protein product [Soboliphyme baturini]|uniref:Transmembrane protein n=1 Tax=Soboliphyme baturini TaxID=241478 RepID=A0A183IGV2_9BILA|nr:unnamed protein product [Soboliphyme baturini]